MIGALPGHENDCQVCSLVVVVGTHGSHFEYSWHPHGVSQ